MNKSCYNCPFLDFKHFDLYEEMVCLKADMIIRRRNGQGRPDDCPLRKENKNAKKVNLETKNCREVLCLDEAKS